MSTTFTNCKIDSYYNCSCGNLSSIGHGQRSGKKDERDEAIRELEYELKQMNIRFENLQGELESAEKDNEESARKVKKLLEENARLNRELDDKSSRTRLEELESRSRRVSFKSSGIGVDKGEVMQHEDEDLGIRTMESQRIQNEIAQRGSDMAYVFGQNRA